MRSDLIDPRFIRHGNLDRVVFLARVARGIDYLFGILYALLLVRLALDGPGVDDLAALLLDRRQSSEGSSWRDAGFLLELPLGGFEPVLTRYDLTLGNRPSAVILVLEKWTTGMGQKHLQLAISKSVHQESCTDSGHAGRHC